MNQHVTILKGRIFILLAIFPSILLSLINGTYKEYLYSFSSIAFWISDLAHFVVIPIVSVILLAKYADLYPRNYGFVKPDSFKSREDLLSNSLIAIFFIFVIYDVTANVAFEVMSATPAQFTYHSVLPSSGVMRGISVFYFAVSTAFAEEIMYRALPWLYLSVTYRKPCATVIYLVLVPLVFGFAHYENGMHEVFTTSVTGFAFAALYLYMRNIWPLITAHFVTNMIVFW